MVTTIPPASADSAYLTQYQREPAWDAKRKRLAGSAAHSWMAAQAAHVVEGGTAAAQPTTFKPADRNNRMARGRWVRLLTSSTECNPRKRSNRADSQAFSKV